MAEVNFVAVGLDDPLAEPLLAELAAEYSGRYGGTPERTMAWLTTAPEQFDSPDGGLFIGLRDGVPVTGGAFTRFDDQTAELKRIWTDGRHRQRGYARRLLAHLEREISDRGYRRVYLTTGPRQPEAEALYSAAGYTRLASGPPAEDSVAPIAFQKTL